MKILKGFCKINGGSFYARFLNVPENNVRDSRISFGEIFSKDFLKIMKFEETF